MEENQNFSKDNNTENILTENTENTQTEAKADKHLLTLHLSHKNGSKTLHLKKGHLIAASVAALIVLGGGAYAGVSYLQTQNRLTNSQQQLAEMEKENRKLTQRTEMLENENEEYTQHINEIQMKTEELENKMTELENTKQSLAEEINNMSGSTTSTTTTESTEEVAAKSNDTASTEADLSTACLSILENGSTSQSGEKTFTTIVTTSYNKATSLSTQLDKMNVMLDLTGASFVDVATNVTETLAQYSSVPMGYPLEEYVISTEFNPDGDPSISDGRVHKGVDLSTRSQILPISATAAGTVVEAAFHNDYGYYVKIDHGNGFTTLYAHNSENLVEVGDTVKKGDVIAMTGSTGMSTGIHCHYEIQLNGIYQNPKDYE